MRSSYFCYPQRPHSWYSPVLRLLPHAIVGCPWYWYWYFSYFGIGEFCNGHISSLYWKRHNSGRKLWNQKRSNSIHSPCRLLAYLRNICFGSCRRWYYFFWLFHDNAGIVREWPEWGMPSHTMSPGSIVCVPYIFRYLGYYLWENGKSPFPSPIIFLC